MPQLLLAEQALLMEVPAQCGACGVGSRSAVVRFPVKGGKLYLYNNNPLYYARYRGLDGVKTGYTVASGPCLVAAARRGRAWVGVVLLHSADTIDQAERLMNAGFAKLRAA